MASIDATKFHSVLNDADADVVLSSNKGTLFRLHKFTLRTTSGYFRSILSSTPKASSSLQGSTSETPITGSPTHGQTHLSEMGGHSPLIIHTLPFPDTPLECVLLMISGLPTTPWSSIPELEEAVAVMEYLDTPGPLSLVRTSCLIPVFLQSPITVYGLGTKFGWDEVSQRAAQLTLPMGNLIERSLSDPGIERQLKKVESAALIRLLAFHQRRRDHFRTLLHSGKFTCGNAEPSYCICGSQRDNSSWRCLRLRLLIEMERDTSGGWMGGREMQEWEEFKKCLDSKCPRSGCGALNYGREGSMRCFYECISELPTTI